LSSWYAREPGPQGQVINDEGDATGQPLSELLQGGPMPVRAALELISYLADILTIAEEDRAIHGDLRPGSVKVQEGGTVAVDGYGARRRGGRAPEGQPNGIATDIYGLGIILHAALASEPMGDIPRDRDAHDDYIVDRLKQLDWGELQGRRWLDDVVHFLCSMLAHEPAERPAALDVANVLAQLSAQTPGEELSDWADRLLTARAAGGARAAPAPFEEELGGPVSISGPVSHTQALRIRKAASAKGESTAFWSPDKIAALLAQEDEEDSARSEPVRARFDPGRGRTRETAPIPPPPAPDNTYGGAAAMLPPPRGLHRAAEPPRPLDPPAPPPRPARSSPAQERGPAAPPPAAWAPSPVAPVANPAPPARSGPAPIAVASPFASAGLQEAPPSPEPAPAGGGALKVVVGVFVVLFLLCLGAGGLGGVYYFVSRPELPEGSGEGSAARGEGAAEAGAAGGDGKSDGDEGSADDDAAADGAATEEDLTQPPPKAEGSAGASSRSSTSTGSTGTGSTSASGGSGSKGGGRSTSAGSTTGSSAGSSTGTSSGSSRSTTSSGGSSAGSTSSSGSSASKKTTTAPPSSGSSSSSSAGSGGTFPAEVKFSLMGKQAKLTCGDGQKKEFVGSVRLEFESITTCMMAVGDAKAAVTVRGAGTWTCTEAGGALTCSPG
jgi:hypothetical protein